MPQDSMLLEIKTTICSLEEDVCNLASNFQNVDCYFNSTANMFFKLTGVQNNNSSYVTSTKTYAKAASSDLKTLVQPTMNNSLLKNISNERIKASLAVYGRYERGHDYQNVEDLLYWFECNVQVASMVIIGYDNKISKASISHISSKFVTNEQVPQ